MKNAKTKKNLPGFYSWLANTIEQVNARTQERVKTTGSVSLPTFDKRFLKKVGRIVRPLYTGFEKERI